MQNISVLLLASAALFIIYHTAYTLFFSRHRRIPGPFLARFTNLNYFYQVYLGRFEYINIALHRQYASPIVRVAPNWYSISDPDALKPIYGPGTKFAKSDWYNGWKHPDPEKYSLFTDRDVLRHAQDRKKFSAMYSMSAMVNYESYVDECAEVFSERLDEFATSGTVANIAHWLQCYAFDVIGKITYSKRFGFLDRGEDIAGLLSALESNMMFSTLSGIYATIYPLVFQIGEWFGGGARARSFLIGFGDEKWKERKEEASKNLRDYEEKSIGAEADEESDKPMDMLAKFLNELDKGKPGWTTRDVVAMTVSNIIAGSDTTAVSLSSILYHLLKYPAILQKVRNEIEEFENKGECGKISVTFKESRAMPYLQAVIKEALRLHPATGLPLWRVVPKGGAEICGHYFAGGEVVGVNTWVIHYDTNVFGSDAAVFRPERWLEEHDAETMRDMERSWMPFGLGSRTCIGKNISMLEMCKLIPQIVRRFNFDMETPDESWKTVNYWFVKQLDFNVRVSHRSGKV